MREVSVWQEGFSWAGSGQHVASANKPMVRRRTRTTKNEEYFITLTRTLKYSVVWGISRTNLDRVFQVIRGIFLHELWWWCNYMYSPCSFVYSFIICNFVFPSFFCAFFFIDILLNLRISNLSPLFTLLFSAKFQSCCLFCTPWYLAKFRILSPSLPFFLYPHSLFLYTLKKPNGETLGFSKKKKKTSNNYLCKRSKYFQSYWSLWQMIAIGRFLSMMSIVVMRQSWNFFDCITINKVLLEMRVFRAGARLVKIAFSE